MRWTLRNGATLYKTTLCTQHYPRQSITAPGATTFPDRPCPQVVGFSPQDGSFSSPRHYASELAADSFGIEFIASIAGHFCLKTVIFVSCKSVPTTFPGPPDPPCKSTQKSLVSRLCFGVTRRFLQKWPALVELPLGVSLRPPACGISPRFCRKCPGNPNVSPESLSVGPITPLLFGVSDHFLLRSHGGPVAYNPPEFPVILLEDSRLPALKSPKRPLFDHFRSTKPLRLRDKPNKKSLPHTSGRCTEAAGVRSKYTKIKKSFPL